jgi:MFS family permease
VNKAAPPATDSAQRRLPRNVLILGATSLVNDIASEMVFPLLPAFLISVLHGNRFSLGVIEGIADSTASFLKLISGGWSDRMRSRRGFVLLGYGVAVLTRPLLGLIHAPWQLAVLRATDRFGKGVRTSPRDALIADSTDPSMRGRAFGFHRAMDHLGAAIGPLLAAGFLWLWPDQFQTLFLWTLLPGLLVLALLLFGLRDVPAAHPAPRRPPLTLAPFDRRFRLFLLSLFVFTLGNSSDAFLLLRAGELGVPTPALPLLWCAFHIAKSSGNWLVGPWVDRWGGRPFILSGWIVYAVIYLGFGLADTAWQAAAFFIAYAVFYALTEPAEKTLVVQLAGSERKGLAYGWYHFANGISTLPASLFFGFLYQRWGALIAFGSGAAFALVAAGILVGIDVPRLGTEQK